MNDTADEVEVQDPGRALKRAVKTLTAALREDPEYRRTWVSNIAMAFYDEVRRDPLFSRADGEWAGRTHEAIHTVSNRAAEYFLNNLCMDREAPEVKGSFSQIMDQIRRTKVLRDVQTERDKQEAKWGQQNHDPFKYLAILFEEAGESSKAAIESFDWKKEDWNSEKLAHYREELIQTAAVAQAAVECLDRGFWNKKEQSLE